MDTILELKHCTKTFESVVVLEDLSIDITRGKIHCIIGENGAGKSTLIKIMSGIYPKNEFSGVLTFESKECHYKSIIESKRDGIAVIHQELSLSPYLSIYENILLGCEKQKGFFIDWRKSVIDAKEVLRKVGLVDDPQTPVDALSVAKQQLVEIAKALVRKPKLLILDEPTSSLNEEDSQKFLDLLFKLKQDGVTMVMISHKLNEIMQMADDITIIRDGKTVGRINIATQNVELPYIIKLMVGRELSSLYPLREKNIGEPILEVKNFTVESHEFSGREIIHGVNLVLRRGEIVGIGGLVGSRRTELMLAIFGNFLKEHVKGEIIYEGRNISWASPEQAIKDGVIYLSEDRKMLGLVLMQSIKSNICYSSLRKLSKWFMMDETQEVEKSEEFRKKLRIKSNNIEQAVETLSGGNQQKVVLSRCLLAQPKVLIIDEPTRGIDILAKNEIYQILNDFVSHGNSIIMISSELPELLGMTDRIYVMDSGKMKGEFQTQEATQEKIMECALS